jgi:hypothetical protein
MNNITIELCKEDRERLDRIADLLEKVTQPIDLAQLTCTSGNVTVNLEGGKNPAEQPQEVAETENQETTYIKEETQPEAQETPENEESAPTVSRDEIRQLVVSKSNAGKKAEVKDIINLYANCVSGIPEAKLDEVHGLLTALEV